MKIGLTYTGSDEKHNNYVRWLKQNESIEVITLSNISDINKGDIKNCDALVLSGGVDIHPSIYGGKDSYPNQPEAWNKERDLFEKTIFEEALNASMPVLGICRGLQLINVFFGGTLTQDLGEANSIHKSTPPDKLHSVNIVKNTLLYEITKKQNCEINSAHHQAVDKLGNGLMINCTSDDGITEGFEWADKKNKSFLICIQWHPERMFQFQLENSPLSKNIRDNFFEEVKHKVA